MLIDNVHVVKKSCPSTQFFILNNLQTYPNIQNYVTVKKKPKLVLLLLMLLSPMPSAFSGPIGKLCAGNFQDKKQVAFKAVPTTLEELSDDVLTDLSTDQRLLYEYVVGISKGSVSERYVRYKIGDMSHARWLTLAIRILSIYVRGGSKLGEEIDDSNLDLLVEFICKVYAPSWFMIKKNKCFHHQAICLFHQVKRKFLS